MSAADSTLIEGLRRVVNPHAYGADIVIDAVKRQERYLGEYRALAGQAEDEVARLRRQVEELESEITRRELDLITESDELDERNAGAIVWDKDGDPWMKMYDGTWFSQLPGATTPISSVTLVTEWGPLRRHEP